MLRSPGTPNALDRGQSVSSSGARRVYSLPAESGSTRIAQDLQLLPDLVPNMPVNRVERSQFGSCDVQLSEGELDWKRLNHAEDVDRPPREVRLCRTSRPSAPADLCRFEFELEAAAAAARSRDGRLGSTRSRPVMQLGHHNACDAQASDMPRMR